MKQVSESCGQCGSWCSPCNKMECKGGGSLEIAVRSWLECLEHRDGEEEEEEEKSGIAKPV